MLNALRRRLAVLAGTGLLVATAAMLGAAAPASAAGELELSLDGRTWSTSLNSGIFPPGQTLVPGSTLDGTFFVRNATAGPAWIRIGVSELTVTSPDLAVAMSLSTVGTTSDAASGSTSRLNGEDIVCNDFLVRSTPLPAGGIIRVDASLSFRQTVAGTTAQDASASIAFIAELSDVDLNTVGTPLCTGSMTVGPVTSSTGGTSQSGGSGNGPGPAGQPGGGGTSGGGSGTGTGSTNGTQGGTSGSGGSGAPTAPGGSGGARAEAFGTVNGGVLQIGVEDMPFNTMRGYEEYAILVLVGAALAGAIARLTAQRH
ncbi:MAG: hypothetical protein BGO95_11015 [Micrococcales bacterium 73-13]|nr:MAG: hypothetical protein BGO95_11015 [Micrococcales bacterium 73-13]